MLSRYRVGLLASLLVVTLTAPLWAQVQIEQVLVRRQGASVNIRVGLSNAGASRQPGPIVLDLYVRKSSHDEWQAIKHWDDIQYIQPANLVVRDFFDANNAVLRDLAASGKFQARAVVTAPGVSAVEQTTSWEDKDRR